MAGKSRGVTDIAAVLHHRCLGTLDAGGVDRPIRRARRRQFGDDLGEFTQIVVAQTLGHVVHWIGHAHMLAEHQQLHRHIKCLLRAKGRHARKSRLALLAMTGKTNWQPLLHALRGGGCRNNSK